MANAFYGPPALLRRAAAAAAALVVLGTGIAFTIRAPQTGLAPTGNVMIWRLQNGSGAQVGGCFDDGSCRFSGSLVSNGSSFLTLTAADARYVNTAGDTMTGTLLITNSKNLQVAGTASASTLVSLGNVTLDGANIGSGTILRRYATFPLTGSGVSTATGTNVFGDYIPRFAGKIIGANAHVSQTANNNLTTVNVKINGTTIFSTNLTIDSTEKDSSTAATAAVLNPSATSFVSGDTLTFDVNAPATTPAKDLKVDLVIVQTAP